MFWVFQNNPVLFLAESNKKDKLLAAIYQCKSCTDIK